MNTTFEIYVSDLTEDAKKRLAEIMGEDYVNDFINEINPLAIIEFDNE